MTHYNRKFLLGLTLFILIEQNPSFAFGNEQFPHPVQSSLSVIQEVAEASTSSAVNTFPILEDRKIEIII
ncbi:hypothetical protein [Candidatus Paracaedibacter symbiosus]|uniref:hypothetical protein n=1 Tax=Candidatus Paracaedibacter symbiosus TaxID=244582 RepID=UPI0012EBCCA3|nr:hypothetical protein [Candidatus Paracaedibacter symbiosus]